MPTYFIFTIYNGLELDFGRFFHFGTLRSLDLVHRLLVEAEHASNEVAWESLHSVVQFAGGRVEETADGSQLVLDVGQFALQLHEVLVCLQVGISLHLHLQSSQSRSQLLVSLDLVVDA